MPLQVYSALDINTDAPPYTVESASSSDTVGSVNAKARAVLGDPDIEVKTCLRRDGDTLEDSLRLSDYGIDPNDGEDTVLELEYSADE